MQLLQKSTQQGMTRWNSHATSIFSQFQGRDYHCGSRSYGFLFRQLQEKKYAGLIRYTSEKQVVFDMAAKKVPSSIYLHY